MSIKAIFEAHIFDLQIEFAKPRTYDTQGQFVEDNGKEMVVAVVKHESSIMERS